MCMYWYLCVTSQVVPLTLVVASLVQISSSSMLLEDIADVVKSLTAPELLQAVVTPSWCGGGGCLRPPSTSASFQFSSSGSPALGSSALSLAPAGLALGLIKGLLIGNDYLENSTSQRRLLAQIVEALKTSVQNKDEYQEQAFRPHRYDHVTSKVESPIN